MMRNTSRRVSILAATVLACGCVTDPDDPELARSDQALQDITIDPRRSLVVTEAEILERFSLERVLDQLVEQSGVPGLTSLALFQQWWDTQNPAPGFTTGPHCDDVLDVSGQPVLNGFPYTCRPAPGEGAQALVDPFVDPGTNPAEYVPIGLFNRFDLTPSDASSCGEYRIVYARRAGIADNRDRNLIIFEMALANPHPQQELKGCRKIVEHWADLTDMDLLADRADALEQLYFDGIPSVPPVVHVDHLGGGPTGLGQVRTNQFMNFGLEPARPWSLREFKLLRTCDSTGCTAMRLVPEPLKNNPFGGLFDPASTHPQAAAFQAAFLDQIPALAAPTLMEIDFKVDLAFDTGQSQASGSTENNYVVQFGTSANPFRDAIAAELAAIGSTLTPDDVVARAQSLSCAGCHRLNANLAIGNGLVSPPAIGFVHVSERDPEIVDGVLRFRISPALTDHFLPKREQVMEDYLNDKLWKPPHPKDPIGGKRVH